MKLKFTHQQHPYQDRPSLPNLKVMQSSSPYPPRLAVMQVIIKSLIHSHIVPLDHHLSQAHFSTRLTNCSL